MNTVCFASKCWSGDWTKLVFGGFEAKAKSADYPFDRKIFLLNNGVPENIAFGTRVDATKRRVLEYFNLTEESFKGGYKYSIAELTAIYLANDFDYLCYVQGDCVCSTGDWVTEGVAILEKNPEIAVVSPRSEVNTWHGADGLDQFFSDQCFLVRVKEFSGQIYGGGEEIPEYPHHGGDSFEKKAAQYLRRTGKYRKILTNHWYDHPTW